MYQEILLSVHNLEHEKAMKAYQKQLSDNHKRDLLKQSEAQIHKILKKQQKFAKTVEKDPTSKPKATLEQTLRGASKELPAELTEVVAGTPGGSKNIFYQKHRPLEISQTIRMQQSARLDSQFRKYVDSQLAKQTISSSLKKNRSSTDAKENPDFRLPSLDPNSSKYAQRFQSSSYMQARNTNSNFLQ